jgi:hypothetical protein
VGHLRKSGHFTVKAEDVDNIVPIKVRHGVPETLSACHTALIDGYIVEGHVPADDIVRLLRERPKVAGIAVPGMPAGSPGMESSRPERYQVLTFDRSGSTKVFASH